ncbi:hypothetical protein DOK79_002082 [Enterococcus sp. DIV1094]|uniref:Transposase putative helix-turn-helix domain-containing protein n=1 Tax=Candidatus Enterococcus mangumiae TaxID=2230878 RepID=A0ABZ2SXR5_9ENTE
MFVAYKTGIFPTEEQKEIINRTIKSTTTQAVEEIRKRKKACQRKSRGERRSYSQKYWKTSLESTKTS